VDREVFSPIYGMSHDELYIGQLNKQLVVGEVASVSFNAQDVLDDADILLGFYHTHPHTIGWYSQIDHQTMEAWCNCLGKDLLCVIQGIDGLRFWLFQKDKVAFVETHGTIDWNEHVIWGSYNVKQPVAS